MKPIMVHIIPDNIVVDSAKIMALPDMASSEGDSYTLQLLENLTAQCKACFAPKAIFLPGKTLVSRFNMGSTLNKMLRNSECYAIFIATAGPGPENLARDFLKQRSYLEGYLCDLIASQLAEGVAQWVHDAIRLYADSQGLNITNRYSPGYCSWDVAEQHMLFDLFGEDTCGIKLSDSALMSPIKSVSGVVGLGSKVKFLDYTCELCNMKDCIHRNTR